MNNYLPKYTTHVQVQSNYGTTIEKDRYENECNITNKNKNNIDETMTNIRSLALPWSIIVFTSILVAGVVVVYQDQQDDSSFLGYSSQSSLERFLNIALDTNNNDYSSGSEEHHQVHPPVYEENHKMLFPLSTSDRVGFFLAICGLMVAAGGGIGGGGILVPIYILVMGFSPKHGIPLSNVTIFGGAVANMVLNRKKRHPLADRPLINWDLILVMEPLTIAGALMGAFLYKILPEQFLTVMLVLLLSCTAQNSLKKAMKMYKAESRKLREQGLKPDGSKASKLTQISQQEKDKDMHSAGDSCLEDMDLHDGENPGVGNITCVSNKDEAHKLQTIMDEERTTSTFNVNILVGLFVVVLVINLLKGGGAFPSPVGIVCGSQAYWIANGIILSWIILISCYVRIYLVKRFELKQKIGYKYVEGDIRWDGRSTIVYPCICCLAGFFAGMFGSECYILLLPAYVVSLVRHNLSCIYRIVMIFNLHFWCDAFLFRSWWRYREGPTYASNGSASGSSFCNIGIYDSFYKLYSNDFLLCFWSSGSTIRTCVFWNWFCCNVLRSNRIGNSHAKSSKKLVYCIFDGCCSTIKRYYDDCTVLAKYSRGRTSYTLRRNLW